MVEKESWGQESNLYRAVHEEMFMTKSCMMLRYHVDHDASEGTPSYSERNQYRVPLPKSMPNVNPFPLPL